MEKIIKGYLKVECTLIDTNRDNYDDKWVKSFCHPYTDIDYNL